MARFRRRGRADGDDLMSAAHQAFMEAHLTFSRRRGTFENWLAFKVNRALREELRAGARRGRVALAGRCDGPREYEHVEPVSGDARHLMELALALHAKGLSRGQTKRVIKAVTREAGWDGPRLAGVIAEIRGTLR